MLQQKHLNLSYSSFFGLFPTEIFHLSELVSIDLSSNLDLLFPEDVFHRPFLQRLILSLNECLTDLSNNKLTGPIEEFHQAVGQASGMAFLGTLPCGKSCYISINGNAKSSWSERKKTAHLNEPNSFQLYSRKYFLASKRTGHKDTIENVLEIKDTHVKEVMTPLVDVVAIDASATLVDLHSLWVTHQYSRVPVFEQHVDNIVCIAYAMDLLDYVQKVDLLESATVGDIAHKPAYFIPDSMIVWNLLREFHMRKVHMAVVLNEYGGTVGGHQYETVSGFICEVFGYIPRTGESMKVALEKENQEEI
ncbi:hypothetical protein Patl1_04062 [Pistacia atlantica]|uniref:Uncharacterized protein n=1 Tax=Pistacia atlantica TaxID=434234 RepID=A0ACC1BVR9_9ROSI|nr:hypothetical protein Patl1_04062 [Pistacia atlantica]